MSTIAKIKHFYPFNTDFNDTIGSVNGTPSGTIIDTVSPLIGTGSAFFDGLDDDIDFGPGTGILSSGARSISFWFKLHINKIQFFVSCNNPEMEIAFVGNKIYVDGSNASAAYFPFTYDTDIHHLAFTDDNAGNYIAYLDNVLKSLTLSDTQGSQANFIVGDNSFGFFQAARFDAMAIADSVLDAADVSFLWNGGAGIELPVSAGIEILRRRMEEY